MTETKAFPTADVMSAITGVLVSEIGGVYVVLDWMADDKLFTHQLPRVGREAQAAMLAFRPEMQAAVAEAEGIDKSNWQLWRDKWVERYGAAIDVPRMSAEQHEHIDALSELSEQVHPDKIVVVKTQ